MSDFFRDMAINEFLLTGLAAGVLASIACGIVGPYVITRRIVFLGGAIAHMAVGGIGAAIWLRYTYPDGLSWLEPVHGAMAVAVLAAIGIGVIAERARERIDTLIGAMWAVGMSVGILLIKYTPGYHVELMSYLFGNIVYVPWSEVRLMLVLDLAILAVVLLFYKRLLAVCIDEEAAMMQGVNVRVTNIVLLLLVALTVISLIQVVGLILVLALLTLPAATAGHYVGRLAPMMVVSAGLAMVLTTVPRIAVYGTGVSPESAVVLAACAVYLVSVLVRRLRAAARP